MKRLLDVNGITKVFGGGTVNEKTVLSGVNLIMNEGDFVTVIGNNGAGKSTLLNCIAGVFPVDAGSIVLDGEDITKQPEHKRARHIGRVFQDPLKGTAFDMTIEQNLAIAYYKNKPRGLQPGITKKDRELFREKLARNGPRGQNDREGKTPFGRSETIPYPPDGIHCQSEAFASRRTYGGT